MLYDTDHAPTEHVDREDPSQDVYVGLNVSVLSAINFKLLTSTSWANEAAYECCKGCQALARRFLDVYTIAATLGPGGAGLSILTGHLSAKYGKNFATTEAFMRRLLHASQTVMKLIVG